MGSPFDTLVAAGAAGASEYYGDQIRRVTLAFLILTWITLLIRCWIRLRLLKAFRADDKVMIVAQVGNRGGRRWSSLV